ncbi:MAG: sugar ABC transporter substrate-binding protein [Desulfurococcales archaeon]|nr:sugar ABC transporter substrate-binding protein [Desulfurococcales archaeon]
MPRRSRKGQAFTSTQIIAVIVVGIVALAVGFYAGRATAPEAAPAAGEAVTVTETVTSTVTTTVTMGEKREPEFTFYYISHGGPADPWWGPVIKGAELAGQMLGVKVVYQGPEKFSIKWLVDALQAASAAKPDGIIITITDYKALDEPLRKVIAQGIPVIAVNVPDPRPPDERIPYLGYVGQDEYQAGYKLAEYVIKWFKEKYGRLPKNAFIGIHEVGHVGLELRAKGIQDAFRDAGAPYVPEKLDITTDITKAYETMKSYLRANPDVEVIFTLGPLGAHPAMQLIRDEGLVGKVYVATVDLDDQILQGIKDGVVIAAVSQQPFAQGFLPVVYMYLYVKYGIVPPDHVPTGPTIITKELLGVVEKQIQTTGGA